MKLDPDAVDHGEALDPNTFWYEWYWIWVEVHRLEPEQKPMRHIEIIEAYNRWH